MTQNERLSKTLGHKGRARRQQIIGVAKRRLIERGLEGLVLREIAEEIAIAHGNLQYYFKTRDALLKAIYDDEAQKYTDSMQEFLSSAVSIEGKLHAIVDSSIRVLESEQTKLWRILFGIADQNPELASILKRENDAYEAEIVRQLQDVNSGLGIKRIKHIAHLLRIIMDGIGVEMLYIKTDSAKFAALKNEIKNMLSKLLEIK